VGYVRVFTAAIALASFFTAGAPTAAGQGRTDTPRGAIRGAALDTSGGVLPGVSVVATAADGAVLATTVTDAQGEYALDDLPAGPVDLTFHLDGFADSRTRVQVQGGGLSQAVERLDLAGFTESIVVRADPPPPPPTPPPTIVPLPPHDEASVCGPAKIEGAPASFGTIQSHRHDARQVLMAAGDVIVVEGGSADGLAVGRNFAARRRFRVDSLDQGPARPVGEHTSGVVQIVEADAHRSLAVVVYACDEVMQGDYLAAFEPEPRRAPEPHGTPGFDDASRILFADAGQMLGFARRMMVIDRGSQLGVHAGQRLTIFRRPRAGGAGPSVLGSGVVVAVRGESATILVEHSSDVVLFGDLVALHRRAERSN
jgi:hypothetical protein